jgi:hypothetical protein
MLHVQSPVFVVEMVEMDAGTATKLARLTTHLATLIQGVDVMASTGFPPFLMA